MISPVIWMWKNCIFEGVLMTGSDAVNMALPWPCTPVSFSKQAVYGLDICTQNQMVQAEAGQQCAKCI